MTLWIRRGGETYSVDDQDRIYRTKAGGFDYDMTPSDQWKLVGAVEYRMVFGKHVIVRQYTVADIRAGKVTWQYKNGQQRCFVVDYDHGGKRVWMSPTPYIAFTKWQ